MEYPNTFIARLFSRSTLGIWLRGTGEVDTGKPEFLEVHVFVHSVWVVLRRVKARKECPLQTFVVLVLDVNDRLLIFQVIWELNIAAPFQRGVLCNVLLKGISHSLESSQIHCW